MARCHSKGLKWSVTCAESMVWIWSTVTHPLVDNLQRKWEGKSCGSAVQMQMPSSHHFKSRLKKWYVTPMHFDGIKHSTLLLLFFFFITSYPQIGKIYHSLYCTLCRLGSGTPHSTPVHDWRVLPKNPQFDIFVLLTFETFRVPQSKRKKIYCSLYCEASNKKKSRLLDWCIDSPTFSY